jgi:2-oxoglutarate dehydrogenase E1 component
LGRIDIPLIILTPKSLLRTPQATSEIDEFVSGEFQEIIDDEVSGKDSIERIILTSGKVYYDLLKYKNENEIKNTAIIRVEQYYPFNIELLVNILSKYSQAERIIWVQEEPENMGAWSFIFNRLYDRLPGNKQLEYVGRKESPSPASGSNREYHQTQMEFIKRAFS